MTLPNFLIIGEHKAGTTSLYSYLSQHPSIFMPALKEPRFFSFDVKYHADQTRKVSPIRTLEEYTALFDGVTTEKAIGEASPEYLPSMIAASKIHALIPDIQLIASVRNPIERAYSGYLMYARTHKKPKPFSEVYRKVSEERSFTYTNLKRYLDLFRREQLKIVFFDDLKSDAEALVRGLFEFLQVDSSFKPNLEAKNVGGLPKFKAIDIGIRRFGKMVFDKFGIEAPKPLKRIAQKIIRANMGKAPPLDENIRADLSAIYRDDIMRLQDLTGRDLSGWLAPPQ